MCKFSSKEGKKCKVEFMRFYLPDYSRNLNAQVASTAENIPGCHFYDMKIRPIDQVYSSQASALPEYFRTYSVMKIPMGTLGTPSEAET
jgi:hypothetical protein